MNQKIVNHFKKVDPILYKALGKVLKAHGKFNNGIVLPENYFEVLCESIVGQQLSVKAGDTIFGRFKKLFKDGVVTPKAILKIKPEKIRECGLSNAKVTYVQDLAKKISGGEVELEKLNELSDEEVIVELTKIKGIGRWTAEMFLMFSLGREDVFSHGDLGLRNAIKKLYSLEDPTVKQVEEIVVKWSPFRTYASRVLWRSLDNN